MTNLIDLRMESFDHGALRLITDAQAHSLLALPVRRINECVLLACHPDCIGSLDEATFLIGEPIGAREATPDSIKWALGKFYPNPRPLPVEHMCIRRAVKGEMSWIVESFCSEVQFAIAKGLCHFTILEAGKNTQVVTDEVCSDGSVRTAEHDAFRREPFSVVRNTLLRVGTQAEDCKGVVKATEVFFGDCLFEVRIDTRAENRIEVFLKAVSIPKSQSSPPSSP